jgi:acetolactate synthase-1/2/3 large subunit
MLFAAVRSRGSREPATRLTMTPPTVSDFIASRLIELGVRHVFGVGGANIEDLFAAVQRRRPAIRAILCKHEHGAGTAADAYARIGRGLGVVFATSGGGTLNLVHALAEARASCVPLLAIVGEPPTELQGRGAFQDTSGRGGGVDAAGVLASVAKYCSRVESSTDVPRLMTEAVEAAVVDPPGPAVLLIAKDRQTAPIAQVPRSAAALPVHRRGIDASQISAACALLRGRSCVVIAGDEVSRAGAQRELATVSRLLGASVAVTPDARDAFDNGDAHFLGVAGGMGHVEVARALAAAQAVLVVGTRLPLLARQGLERLFAERALVWVGREAPFVTTLESSGVSGPVDGALRALAEELAHDRVRRMDPLRLVTRVTPASPPPGTERDFTSSTILAAVERAASEGSIIVVDAGNTGASVVHGMRVPSGGHWLLAMGMAGMGWAFGGSIGAALASGQRCFVLAGDGAFFMHGFEIHTAVEHELPITFVVFNNRAHGMCLVRERLLLRTDAGYNEFRPSHLGVGLAAMFPGLPGSDCTNLSELESALTRASTTPGPTLISVEFDGVEVPPFVAFQAAGGAAFSRIERSKPA